MHWKKQEIFADGSQGFCYLTFCKAFRVIDIERFNANWSFMSDRDIVNQVKIGKEPRQKQHDLPEKKFKISLCNSTSFSSIDGLHIL